MTAYRHILRVAAMVLLISLCLCLAACRPSPVLCQVEYDHTSQDVDEDHDMLQPEDSGEEEEDFDNSLDDDAETPRDDEAKQGLKDDEGKTDQSTDPKYSPNVNNDWQSGEAANDTSGKGDSNAPGQNSDSGDGGETNPQPAPGGNSGKQIVDGSGRTVDLPEQAQSVAAVGWAAQTVSMLSGGERLTAADSEFLSDARSYSGFDLSDTQQAWGGSGGQPMSEDSFAQLLAGKPDVCFEISGQYSFSEDQVRRLTEAGIPYVVLPSLTSMDNLKQAVDIIAYVLADPANADDPITRMAAAYSSWLDSTLYQVDSRTGSQDLSSLYISDWDYNASYTLNYTKGVFDIQGSGMAVAWSPLKTQMISSCMEAANMENESTRVRSIHRDSEGLYVSPMFHQFDPSVSGSKGVYYSGSGEYGAAFDLFVSRMIDNTVYYQLGSYQFPAIVVANDSIKNEIENNWFWQYHETDNNGYINVGGESFYCGVVGTYNIYVNPHGMCDWAQGSLESPLESVWLAYKFGGAYSLSEVKQITADFYRQFFNISLSDSQLYGIFGE